MKNEINKQSFGISKKTVALPKGSLWRDLRAVTGNSNGLEWMFLYEDDPMTMTPSSRLLYVKVIILTPEGRQYAESGQAEILRKCNLRKFETAWFCRALAVAMTEWDSK